MKQRNVKFLVAALFALTFLVVAKGSAEAKFGAGLTFGNPAGITGEFAGKGRAKGKGLGQSFELTANQNSYAHLVMKFYFKNLVSTGSFKMPMYVGVGGFAQGSGDGVAFFSSSKGGNNNNKGGKGGGNKDKSGGGIGGGGGGFGGLLNIDDMSFGARVPVGLAVEFKKLPAHIFVEVAAYTFGFNTDFVTDTAMGFRYFF